MHKRINLAPAIGNDAGLTIAVERIDAILTMIVGDVANLVTAEWEVAGDPKSRDLFLKLWYEDLATGATFHPDELGSVSFRIVIG